MAPRWPEEVDVFSVPHMRMKKLVHKYSNLITATDFRDECHLTALLENLKNVFTEFKAHEQIENLFIMKELRLKLRAASVTNAAVCNCHSDNRLTDMLDLVTDGYRWAQKTERERQLYGRRLKRALEDFTENFIPHMEEEEEVFQPMLMEYFSYEELKDLKAKVIHQHDISKPKEDYHFEKFVEDNYKSESLYEEACEEECHFSKLPNELCVRILSYLNPKELACADQVSVRWHQMARDPLLWPKLYPVHWALGDWSFNPTPIEGASGSGTFGRHFTKEEEEDGPYMCLDEDADVDESGDSDEAECADSESLKQILKEAKMITSIVKHLLPKVGVGVKVCDLAYSRGISSSLVHKILKLCPNLEMLDLTHTKIGDAAFKEFGENGRQPKLKHLDLTGCENITDQTLFSLASSHVGDQLFLNDEDEFDVYWTEDEVEIENIPPPCTQKVRVCCQQVCCRAISVEHKANNYVPASVNGSCGGFIDDSQIGSECESADVASDDYEKKSRGNVDVSEVGDPQTCDLSFVYLGMLIDQDETPSSEVHETSLETGFANICLTSQANRYSVDNYGSADGPKSSSQAKRTCGLGGDPRPNNQSSSCSKTISANVPAETCVACSPTVHYKLQDCAAPEEKRFSDSNSGAQSYDGDKACCLEFLSFNGCYRITDVGLSVLAEGQGTPHLLYLDLSGCLQITGAGLSRLVSTAPRLDHSNLFYCDNIVNDPYPATASGCLNLQCGTRFCCSFKE